MGKILVTGGAGFIGSHLVKRLVKNGDEVVVLDTLLRGNKLDRDIFKAIEFVKGDVKDKFLVDKLVKGCDLVYHFAAVLGVDVVADNPVETMDTEVIGMQNVAEAALENDVEKIIYASTSGVYGDSAIKQSATETIQLDPRTSYAIAKRYNEIYLAAQFEEKGLNSISLRFFNVYGPNQDSRMVVPRFFEQALAGQSLTVFGNGQQTRDFTYIDDTITSCIKLAEAAKGAEIYNIANEHEFTIEQLAKQIIKVTDSNSKIQYVQAPKKRYDYEVERRYGNSKKLYKAIGYKPETSLKDGLHIILNHIKKD